MIDDLPPFDTSPSLAQATGRTGLDGLERLVAQAPGGQKVFRTAVADTTEKVRQGVDKLVSDLTKGKGVVQPLSPFGRCRQTQSGGDHRNRPRDGRLHLGDCPHGATTAGDHLTPGIIKKGDCSTTIDPDTPGGRRGTVGEPSSLL